MSQPLGVCSFFLLLFQIRLVGRVLHTRSVCTGTHVCSRVSLFLPSRANSHHLGACDRMPRALYKRGRSAASTHRKSLINQPWGGFCLLFFSSFHPPSVRYLAQLEPEAALAGADADTPRLSWDALGYEPEQPQSPQT